MLLKDVLQKTTLFFKEKGIESPRLDTEILLAHALKWDRIKLYLNYDYPLSEAELESCRSLVRRRSTGEPIAYILGSRDFFKSNFVVEPGVLVPRPETELLVEEVLSWAQARGRADEPLRLIDLGCGSGCIGLSLLKELPAARLLAVDNAATAIRVTRENARRLGVDDRITTWERSATELAPESVAERLGSRPDIVVANPPYISPEDPDVQAHVRKFEPHEALFSPENGLFHIRSWSSVAAQIASPGAFVMFEIGSGQGNEARQIFEKQSRFQAVEIVKDLSQHERFIRCTVSAEN